MNQILNTKKSLKLPKVDLRIHIMLNVAKINHIETVNYLGDIIINIPIIPKRLGLDQDITKIIPRNTKTNKIEQNKNDTEQKIP